MTTCGCLQQLKQMGALNLESLLAIKESGQSIDSVPIDMRTSMYSDGVSLDPLCTKPCHTALAAQSGLPQADLVHGVIACIVSEWQCNV